ncbi:MAG: hypothetical protein ACRELY_12205, partial [Polyangiaceae bacterium]
MAPRVFLSLAIGGCTVACSHAPAEPGSSSNAAAVSVSAPSVLEWGSDEGAIGLRPNAPDHLAQGASAIAVAPDDAVFVLDGVNARVLSMAKDGSTRVAISNLPVDADDIAIGPDGAVAVYGALTQKITIFDHGQRAQEIAVPRVFREVDRISLGASRRVSFRTGLGETLELGSPSFPLPLDVVLASKREGAVMLRDGTGVRAEVTRDKDGHTHAALVRVAKGAGERAEIVGSHALDAGAIHVVGAVDNIACARLEHVSNASGAISVKREAVCVDMDSDRETLRVDLGAPGMYTPRGELAVGGAPAVLAFAHPEDDGLRITTYAIGGGV